MVSDGTDNHLLLVDLRSQGIDGARLEKVLEKANIHANKNTIPTDKSAVIPKGIRIGTPAMTSRGFEDSHFEEVGEFINRGIEITKKIKGETEGKKLRDFSKTLNSREWDDITEMRSEVESLAGQFPTVGNGMILQK